MNYNLKIQKHCLDGSYEGNIIKSTRDISNTASHMYRGLVDLAKYIIKNDTHDIIFDWFSTGPFEKCFSKLRQGSRVTYFEIAEIVIEKVNINHTKLPLQLEVEVKGIDGYFCEMCLRDLNEDQICLLDSLEELEELLSKETDP